MAISVLNWAIAKTILERDRPHADPDEINRFSVLAALMPGTVGLILPFIAESSLPEKKETQAEIDAQISKLQGEMSSRQAEIDALKKQTSSETHGSNA